MAKYHINNNKIPGECEARVGNCPYGGENEHFASFAEAIVAAEFQLRAEHDYIATHKRDKIIYHIGEKGSVEECPYAIGYCKIKPFGKYPNTHYTDKNKFDDLVKALRVAQGLVGQEAPEPVAPAPTLAKSANDFYTKTALSLRDSGDDNLREKGYTEDEIQKHKNSCGHWIPPRFNAPLPRLNSHC